MKTIFKIRYSTIVNILISFIIVCYVGPFASYKGSLIMVGLLGMILLFLYFKQGFYSKKYIFIWYILSIYLILNSLLNLPNSLKYLLVFFVGLSLVQRKLFIHDYKQVFLTCKLVSILNAFFTIIQSLQPDFYYSFAKKWFFYSNQYEQVVYLGQYCKKLSGLFYEVSFSALILSIGIILYTVELFENRKKIKYILNVCLILISYYAIILTGKRSFILIVPSVIVLLYLFKMRQQITIKHIIILFIGLIIFAFSSNVIYDIVLNIVSKGKGDGADLSSRELFWGLAFNMFKSNPLIGKGLNSFDIFFNTSGIREMYYDFAGAHNSYVQILGETGLMGFLLYFFAIFHSLFRGLKIIFVGCKDEIYLYGAVGILLVMLVYAFSGNVLYQPQQIITIFWNISIIENYYKKEIKKTTVL